MFEDLSQFAKPTPFIKAREYRRSFLHNGEYVLPTRKARIGWNGHAWVSDCPDAIGPGFGKTPNLAFHSMLNHCSAEARRDFLLVAKI
jgi:hypothetical protein